MLGLFVTQGTLIDIKIELSSEIYINFETMNLLLSVINNFFVRFGGPKVSYSTFVDKNCMCFVLKR